jgi:cysteine desulfurase / selenocysteine lyase
VGSGVGSGGSSIDVERVRADTPGCAHVVHLNNAGASLPATPTLEALVGHLELEARIGGYAAADAAADRLDQVYASIATLIGARPDEIALVENATRAWDLAFYSFPLGPGDRILTSRSEYASNVIAMLQVARRTGASVEVVPDDEDGQLSVDALRDMLDDRVKLVAVGWIPTQGGLVNPVHHVGAVTRAAGIPFLLDACQAVGQLVVDVDAIGCDLLSATGRKYLRGPRGTGFLYVRRELVERLEPPFLDVHSARWVSADRFEIRADARRFETWECNHACRLGLGAAVDYALALGGPAIETRVRALGASLRERLASDVAGVHLHDLGVERCGIVTFTVDGSDPYALAASLRTEAVNISVSTIDFARFDFESRGFDAVARASVHYYNTDDELDRFVTAVDRLTRPTT